MRFTAKATCGFRMGRWYQGIVLSCLAPDRLDCSVLSPAWCRSVHTRLIDSVLNDALHTATECLHPTPAKNLPVLSRIQPAELRCQGAILSLANRRCLDSGHILHGQLAKLQAASKERLKSRHPFVPAARKLLPN